MMKRCWVCNKAKKKYFQSHHVLGQGQPGSPEVDVCRGCHYLVTLLGRVKLLADPKKVANLLALARAGQGLPDARVIVTYEAQ